MKQIKATIESVEELPPSRAGTPRYNVHLTDGQTLETEADAGVNFYLLNMVGKPVHLVLTSQGRVIGVEWVR